MKIFFSSKEAEGSNTIKINDSKFVDSAGGFLIDERDQEADDGERAAKIARNNENEAVDVPLSYQQW